MKGNKVCDFHTNPKCEVWSIKKVCGPLQKYDYILLSSFFGPTYFYFYYMTNRIRSTKIIKFKCNGS